MASNVATADGLSEPAGLSQGERVIDAFIAPSATFHDIVRNQSWWLPALLIVLFSFAQAYTVQRQVGFDRVTQNQLQPSSKQADAMNQLPPDQRAARMAIMTKFTAGITYAMPVILLLGFAFYALVLWGLFNFLLGASTGFSEVFAVCLYSSLPYILLTILVIITLFFGGNAESYDYRYPAATGLGYFLTDTAPWLRALLGRLDLIQLWSLVLTTLGMAIVAKKSMLQSALVVAGWWVLVTILSVGGAAMQS